MIEEMKLLLKKIRIKKIGFNSRITINGHKRKGMTNNTIVVVRNEKIVKNWLHAASSRVKKRGIIFVQQNIIR